MHPLVSRGSKWPVNVRGWTVEMNERSLIGLLEIVLLREACHYKCILHPVRLWKRSNNQEVR